MMRVAAVPISIRGDVRAAAVRRSYAGAESLSLTG
jgi:hypothetical protein